MDIPQAFLLTDAILKLYINITSDMVVYPMQIDKLLKAELPFMSTEKILMEAVKKGKSRQEMHEVIKDHSIISGKMIKEYGQENDLLERLAQDDRIPFTLDELNHLIGNYKQFTGRATAQTAEYLEEVVYPLLKANEAGMGVVDASLSV